MAGFETNAAHPGHDIIVIGASAGGLRPLQCIVGDLPPGLAAAVFIVLHVGRASILAPILQRAGPLPTKWAVSGEPIAHGTIYVAPPGRHLLLHEGHVLLRRGPQENLARPAIDALFRSAAATFGARVVGVVLSGMLNDGTAGLRAIKRCGGTAIVQDPGDAALTEMPLNALRYAEVDHTLPAAAIGALLAGLVAQPAGATLPIPRDIRLEAAVAAQELADMHTEDRLGQPSRFTCPECHGTLWEIEDGGVTRYRCHVGHAHTAETMLAAQTVQIEQTLWSLMRAHRERAAIVRRLAERAATPERAAELRQSARNYDEDAEIMRRFMQERHGGGDGTAQPSAHDAI